MKAMEIRTEGYATLDKDVKSGSTSGRIFVPKEWMGKRVRVILVEPLEEGDPDA